MAAPVLQTGWGKPTSGGAAASSLVVARPTGLVTGDLWLIIAGDDADGDTNNWAAHADFDEVVHAGDATSDSHMQVYARIATTDTEADRTISHGGVSDELWALSIRITGVESTAALSINQSAATAGSATTSYVITGITPDVDETLILYATCHDGGDTTWSVNSGDSADWTQEDTIYSGTSGNDACGSFGTKNADGVKDTSTGTVTIDSTTGDGVAGLMIAIAPSLPAVIDQDTFRARNDDGSESAATWKAAANTNWTQAVDENFRVRFLLQNTGDSVFNPNSFSGFGRDFRGEYKTNAGSWTEIGAKGTTAEDVVFFLSSYFPDFENTTQQLGSGTFETGLISENRDLQGSKAITGLPASKETEGEICLQIVDANVSDGDTIQLRYVGYDGTLFPVLDSYTNTPTITVGSGGSVTAAPSGEVATSSITSVIVSTEASVTVSVTGEVATSSVESVTVDSEQNITAIVTGESATSSIESVSVVAGISIIASVSGEVSTSSIESVSTLLDFTVPVTGEEAVSSIESVSTLYDQAFDVTGITIASSHEDVTVIQGAGVAVDLTGQQATSGITSVTVSTPSGTDVAVDITGEAMVSSVEDILATGYAAGWGRCKWNRGIWGQPTPCDEFILSGETITTIVGAISIVADRNIIVDVTGEVAASSITPVSVAEGVGISITGEAAASSIEDVTVDAVQNVIVSVTGEVTASSVDDVTVFTQQGVTVEVTGEVAASNVTSVSVDFDYTTQVSGEEAVSSVESVTVITGGNVFVAVTGEESTSAYGLVAINSDFTVQVTGEEASSATGSVSVEAETNIVVDVSGESIASSNGSVAVLIGGLIQNGWGRCTWGSSVWNRGCFYLSVSGELAHIDSGAVEVQTGTSVIASVSGEQADTATGDVVAFVGDIGVIVSGIEIETSISATFANQDYLVGRCGDIASYAIGGRAIADICYGVAISVDYSDTCIESLTVLRGIVSLTNAMPDYEIEEQPPTARDIESLTAKRSILHDNDCQC